MLTAKRIYDGFDVKDGFRILVDRLWPRGKSKEEAKIDLWLKDIAPSKELRLWFNHDPQKWPEFKKRYLAELRKNSEAVEQLTKAIKQHDQVTILFAAKDTVHNNAVALLEIINKL